MKYAARKQAIAKVVKIMAAQTTATLVQSFDMTETMHTPEADMARGWIMDELERRNESAFWTWVDSTENSPCSFFCA